MTAAQLATLKTELATDPRGYGYVAGADFTDSQILNTTRDGTNPPAAPTAAGGAANGQIAVKRNDIRPVEVLQAIDTRDFNSGNTASQLAWFQALCNVTSFSLVNPDGSSTLISSDVQRLIGNTNGSLTRLNAVGTRNGSRAEELFGTGNVVSQDDCAAARNS